MLPLGARFALVPSSSSSLLWAAGLTLTLHIVSGMRKSGVNNYITQPSTGSGSRRTHLPQVPCRRRRQRQEQHAKYLPLARHSVSGAKVRGVHNCITWPLTGILPGKHMMQLIFTTVFNVFTTVLHFFTTHPSILTTHPSFFTT
jgi:hypothetical protein